VETALVSSLSASYFDGVHARAHPVTLYLQRDALKIKGDGIDLAVALRDVQWPERTRHGMRVAHFKSGGSVQCSDAAAWDLWSRSGGLHDSLIVKLQQSWRGALFSVAALIVIFVAIQRWGLPVAARGVVAAAPMSVDVSLGEASMQALDNYLMRPSKLPVDEQTRLRAYLAQALQSLPTDSVPHWQLVFRESRIGPNALALPGGTLVMTDELVELVGHDEKVITAVLAHEMGHVRHRHGLRMLVQVTVLGGLASVVLGDFSTLLAGVPVLLGQASYSREAEQEADADAVRVLKAAGISPAVIVTLFEKLEEKRRKSDKRGDATAGQASWVGIAFASHPSDADRVHFFKEAAGH